MDYRRMPIEAESPEQFGYERIRHNLAESSVADTPLRDLGVELDELVLMYGDHVGRPALRAAIAAGGPGSVASDDVLVTPGAAAALFIVHTTLLGAGDEIVVVRPNYATNLETPRAIGATVRYLDLRHDEDWRIDPDRIAALIGPRTVLVSITNPHNPTGQVMPETALRAIVELVEAHPAARLLVDETYREMTFGGPLPLAASLSERAIGVSSLSKTDGLPGIRIGWLMTRDRALLTRFLAAKEQILITNSVVDEAIAEVAMRRRPERLPVILGGIAAALGTVRGWMASQDLFEWVEPRGGVVGFPRFRADATVDVERFYRLLLERHGTIVGPGDWFEQPDTSFRLGYGWPTPPDLEQGLAGLAGAAVGAWSGPRSKPRPRRGASIGTALLEMDRQIIREIPRVEEMRRLPLETATGLGDDDLVVRFPPTAAAPERETEIRGDDDRPGDDGPASMHEDRPTGDPTDGSGP